MASLNPQCVDEVRAVTPGFASIGNPIDVTGKLLRETAMIGQVVRSVLRSPEVDVAMLNLSSGIDESVGGKWISDLAAIRATASKPLGYHLAKRRARASRPAARCGSTSLYRPIPMREGAGRASQAHVWTGTAA